MQNYLQFFLPTYCPLCKAASRTGICSACQDDFINDQQHRCSTCALPIADKKAKICGNCLKSPPHFDSTITCTDYHAPIDSIVLGLKFAGNLSYANVIAQQLHDRIKHSLNTPHRLATIICPVPLSQQRLRMRGFNQALEIARPISTKLAIPLQTQLLWRVKDTQQQSRLHPDERYQNVQHAFAINPRLMHLIEGQHFGLIDDVMTTGTTLNEIAKLLKRYGAARVSNYVFARTNRD